ncbi:MAG TPA: PilZ domain-containing protein [Gammaproteobacteria bacterium]|nr:PilZ domain-containing protein [Gammaproteobacteria bacterium]
MSIVNRAPRSETERRQFPRVAITLPVRLRSSAGQTAAGLMHNVSPGGMQVRLSAESAARLLAAREEIESGGACHFRAQFLVPLRGERVAISVHCIAAHVSRIPGAPAAARTAIGFRFKRFKDIGTLRRFVLFIEEQLVPMEDYELYLHGRALPQRKSSSKKNKAT